MKAKKTSETRRFVGKDVIDLDKLATPKGKKYPDDRDFLLTFGGAEFIIEYRVENANRPGHPFIDLCVLRGASPITLDVCPEDGPNATVKFSRKKDKIVQLLIGQHVNNPEDEP